MKHDDRLNAFRQCDSYVGKNHKQLFIEARNAVFKYRHNRACLVYECFRYGNFGKGDL